MFCFQTKRKFTRSNLNIIQPPTNLFYSESDISENKFKWKCKNYSNSMELITKEDCIHDIEYIDDNTSQYSEKQDCKNSTESIIIESQKNIIKKNNSKFNSFCTLFTGRKLNKNTKSEEYLTVPAEEIRHTSSCCSILTNPVLEGPKKQKLKQEVIMKPPKPSSIVFDSPAPIASPEPVTPLESTSSSPIRDSSYSSPSVSSVSPTLCIPRIKYKLLHEGDVSVCHLNHQRTVVSKVLSSKFLRRWETHHIYLNDYCISSKTPNGFLETSVPYSVLEDIYIVSRWDHCDKYCLRLILSDGSLLFQVTSSTARNQWLQSLLWKKNIYKFRKILQKSSRPEVILKEVKNLVNFSMTSQLQDDCIINVPIEIISKLLQEDEIWSCRRRREDVITLIAPLLEDNTPSTEMCDFFSQHCSLHPRSPVVAAVLTPIVHRILKRNVDFGKSLTMRKFVADYIQALYSQNDGEEAIHKFVANVHGPNYGCPHPRVLPNFVAVCLAAIFTHFEKRRTVLNEIRNNCDDSAAVETLDKELLCFVCVLNNISDYDDWRPGLSQLLQPIPFPDEALSHDLFIKHFTPIVARIGTDKRCEVHEMILGIRESKDGWFQLFCPSSLACTDDGTLWCQMLETLFDCCCRRKGFVLKLVKQLGSVSLVALRDHAVAQDALCLMLEWRLLNSEDQEMQVATTLQSTENGRYKYKELCRRQEHLRELQKKGGPRKLTLPSRSTDSDVACLLSCGSFGNLECLSLAFTHVTSACAHLLIQLPSLRYLNLWATQFGDAGLIVIAEHLDKLQVLNLCETPVSDKGIASLVGMINLRKLNLNSTKLSLQTLEILKEKLPSLQELDVRYTDAW